MNNVFSNLHFRTSNIDEIEKIIRNFRIHEHNSDNPLLAALTPSFPFYVSKLSEDWVTVLNEALNWETVIPLALELSKKTNIPSITVGFERDCFFATAVIKDNEILTTNVTGREIDLWGMKKENFNLDIFCETLNLSLKKFQIEKILAMRNINTMLEKLEKMLGVPLWLSPQWINKLYNDNQTIIRKV